MPRYNYSFKIDKRALSNLNLLQRFIYLKLAQFKKKNNILKIDFAEVSFDQIEGLGPDEFYDNRSVTVTVTILTGGGINNHA